MSLGIGRRDLIKKIVSSNWADLPNKKKFSYNELLFVIQEMLDEEGKHYLQPGRTLRGHRIFRDFVKHLMYRNIANYDSMVLITSEKGCITDDSLIEMPRDLKKYPKGIPVKKLIGKKNFFVYSYNIKTNIIEQKKAKECVFAKYDDVYEIELTNGQKLKATGNHPFLLKNGRYKEMNNLSWTDKPPHIQNICSSKYTDRPIIFFRPDNIKDIMNPILSRCHTGGVIKSIHYIGKRNVYDIVGVEDNKNFIANGFIVSNTGKSSAAIMMAREWCRLLGIRFSPKRHIAYNNADVLNKIESLNKFEPLICVSGDTEIRICDIYGKEFTKKINNLVDKKGFKVLSYNVDKEIFEYRKINRCVETYKEAEVYEIKTEDGKKIQATKDHKFLTINGWRKLEELKTGDDLVGY